MNSRGEKKREKTAHLRDRESEVCIFPKLRHNYSLCRRSSSSAPHTESSTERLLLLPDYVCVCVCV